MQGAQEAPAAEKKKNTRLMENNLRDPSRKNNCKTRALIRALTRIPVGLAPETAKNRAPLAGSAGALALIGALAILVGRPEPTRAAKNNYNQAPNPDFGPGSDPGHHMFRAGNGEQMRPIGKVRP